MQIFSRRRRLTQVAYSVVVVIACFGAGSAQSTDVVAPSPVRSNEVTGTISARDIGDPRLTDHYYAVIGNPGDLLITVDTRNLNGDIDVFTSSGLRPLLKFTVYADSTNPITKSIYFRKREDLIVRVEARTPNDDPGTYRIYFGGTFEPITSGPLLAEAANTPIETTEPTTTTAKKGRRVSSVGARIKEPEPAEEVATDVATTTEPAEPPPPRTRRGRRGNTRRGTTTQPPPAAVETTESTAQVEQPSPPASQPTGEPAETTSAPIAEPTRSTAASRRGGRRGATRRARPQPVQEPEPETGPRLIIETNDGTLIDRYMNTVRRVTVENGQVVVIGKDGKINRIQLANVVRMSISP